MSVDAVLPVPGDGDAGRRPELSAAKRALHEARMRGLARPATLPPAGGGRARAPLLRPGAALVPGPAAAGDLRLQLPGRPAAHGEVDEAALEQAMGEAVRRHEVQRTTLREVDGAPAQVVAPFAGFRLEVDDLSALEPAAREGKARRRADGEAARPFDLARGPLYAAFTEGRVILRRDGHPPRRANEFAATTTRSPPARTAGSWPRCTFPARAGAVRAGGLRAFPAANSFAPARGVSPGPCTFADARPTGTHPTASRETLAVRGPRTAATFGR